MFKFFSLHCFAEIVKCSLEEIIWLFIDVVDIIVHLLKVLHHFDFSVIAEHVEREDVLVEPNLGNEAWCECTCCDNHILHTVVHVFYCFIDGLFILHVYPFVSFFLDIVKSSSNIFEISVIILRINPDNLALFDFSNFQLLLMWNFGDLDNDFFWTIFCCSCCFRDDHETELW